MPEYSDDDQGADFRHGKRDGRKLLPAYSEVLELVRAGANVTTPYQQMLIRSGVHEISERYRDFLRRADGHRHRIAGLRIALAIAEQAVLRGRDDLVIAHADLTETDLQPRSPQEIPLLGTAELRGRRLSTRDQRIAAARQELDRRVASVEHHQKEIEETSDMIDKEFAHAQASGRKVADYYLLRVATYWDAVVQTHSEGRNLATILPPTTFPLPEWVDAIRWIGDVTRPRATEDTTPAEETTS
ncbi:MAG TPA: hypothetical protein VH352_02755 [Pseudonocardiaceae bacterium]|nr:hypothetical protein [Pseudonocardiaceae bacterium]